MRKNKIAHKLSIYFALALFVFALIIGIVFIILFQRQTLELHKTKLIERSVSISSTLSNYMDRSLSSPMGGYGAYLRFIKDIAAADVWIVDNDFNLLTSGMGHNMMGDSYVYSDLPLGADRLIREVLKGKIVFSEDFSGLLSELTLTVGTPIQSSSGNIIGAVLLHSPVDGINEAFFQGLMLLAISIAIALIIAFVLSLHLAKHFTDPIISKEAEDALRLEKIRREFVANISHELKTPITVLRGSLEALVDKVIDKPDQIDDYHHKMLVETIFLQRLVGDLLDLSKLQNADFSIAKSKISFSECLTDCIRSISQIAVSKKILISYSNNNENNYFIGDYGRIRQMILIVLDNAIKFSPEGSSVEVVLADNLLTIQDYGEGIPKEDLPYIFDRFYKARSEANKTGTGLGLAIAKQIADRHAILLWAESIKGKGACFFFKIPLL